MWWEEASYHLREEGSKVINHLRIRLAGRRRGERGVGQRGSEKLVFLPSTIKRPVEVGGYDFKRACDSGFMFSPRFFQWLG